MTPLEEEEIAGAINDLYQTDQYFVAIEQGNLGITVHNARGRATMARKRLERLVEPQDTKETVQ